MQNVPHQIVQSPARLGLPTPNSPSLQNTTPPKFSSQTSQSHPPHQQSNLLTTTSTSSTLLPLLPPLPRAQSLLFQLAALASRLFEVSPNRALWISSFRGSIPSFLSQTQSLTSGQADSSLTSAKDVLSQFTILQTQLFEAVSELQEILDLQDSKQKVVREIQTQDSAILSFAKKLNEAERVLDILVDDYADYRKAKRSKSEDSSAESSTTTIATHLKLSDVLSYAHKISYTTFAPPEFGAGQGPLRGALPPAPQEEQMRASQLYAFADLDVGLPKTENDKEKALEPFIEQPTLQPGENNLLANLPSLPGLLPGNIAVPSGWKPGMPVEVPLPPPGWKPGDPISLPPFGALPVPPREEGQQPRPALPPMIPKIPVESIQVRHVELDIEDDSEDDYSSEEASSDSED